MSGSTGRGGLPAPIAEAVDAWSDRVPGGVDCVAKAAGFVHFTLGYDDERNCRVVAPQHSVIAFPLQGKKCKHHSALLTLTAVREDKIPRDPNVQGPVANHLRYKPPAERRAIPGADEYIEFELLSRPHEKPSQQPLRIAMGAARTNEETGQKEFVRIDLGQCIAFIATDIIEDPHTAQRLVQNRWWMCLETLRLLCTVNHIDCTALDKAEKDPLEWVICLVDSRAPINKKEEPLEPPERNINELMDFIDGSPCPSTAMTDSQKARGGALKLSRGKKKKGTKEKVSDELLTSKRGDGAATAMTTSKQAVEISASLCGDAFAEGEMLKFDAPAVLERDCSFASTTTAGAFTDGTSAAGSAGVSRPAPSVEDDFRTSERAKREDASELDLMDELLVKYQRLQEANRKLEQDTKIDIIRSMLEVFDELDHARIAADSDNSRASRALLAIGAKFEAKLRSLGLSRVETLGRPFDPRVHRRLPAAGSDAIDDSLGRLPEHPLPTDGADVPGAPPLLVAQELASGWTLGDISVRTALVEVEPR